MKLAEAISLLRPAVAQIPGTWADLGAGRGTFTEALATILGSRGTVIAVDRDREAVLALEQLRDLGEGSLAAVVAVHGDFQRPDGIPELRSAVLDGALFANALHFVPDAAAVLRRIAACIRPGGRLVVIEYDRTSANPWVPYPLPPARLRDVASAAGFPVAEVVARHPSRYHREMYCAVAERAARHDISAAGSSS